MSKVSSEVHEYMWSAQLACLREAQMLRSLDGCTGKSVGIGFSTWPRLFVSLTLGVIHAIASPAVAPTPIPRNRSKSTIVLAIVLTLFVLASLYYMVFVITVPCGASLGGHWTIWQMITGGGCR